MDFRLNYLYRGNEIVVDNHGKGCIIAFMENEMTEETKKKRASRQYITIQTNREKKEVYRQASERRGFKTISEWFRGLAYRDMGKK